MVTFTLKIARLCQLEKLQEARQVIKEIEQLGLKSDVVTYRALVDRHCKLKKMKET
jgi:hypothetical protein